jgi:hypothetical protein
MEPTPEAIFALGIGIVAMIALAIIEIDLWNDRRRK